MSGSSPLVYLKSLSEMFRARDWLLNQWNAGLMPAEEAQRHLRSMAVRDSAGSMWMLRPTETGSVLVRVSLTGEVSMPLPEDYISPKKQNRIGTAAIVFGGFLWVVVAYTWLRGG